MENYLLEKLVEHFQLRAGVQASEQTYSYAHVLNSTFAEDFITLELNRCGNTQ